MPQTKGQGVVFGILMSVFMAYGMELYNVAAKVGGMENKMFWLALKEADRLQSEVQQQKKRGQYATQGVQ